ncbi:unnamed protein product, partial [Closterium sp. NIES-54]
VDVLLFVALDSFAPPDSFLNADSMHRDELRRTIVAAAEDPVKYATFHAWRRCGVLGHYQRALRLSIDSFPCRLCAHISSIP